MMHDLSKSHPRVARVEQFEKVAEVPSLLRRANYLRVRTELYFVKQDKKKFLKTTICANNTVIPKSTYMLSWNEGEGEDQLDKVVERR
jgi:hypothetical protein